MARAHLRCCTSYSTANSCILSRAHTLHAGDTYPVSFVFHQQHAHRLQEREELANQLHDSQGSLQRLQQEYDAAVAQLQGQCEDLTSQLTSAQDQIAAAQERLDSAERRAADADSAAAARGDEGGEGRAAEAKREVEKAQAALAAAGDAKMALQAQLRAAQARPALPHALCCTICSCSAWMCQCSHLLAILINCSLVR